MVARALAFAIAAVTLPLSVSQLTAQLLETKISNHEGRPPVFCD